MCSSRCSSLFAGSVEAALGAWPLAWPDANGMDRPLGLDEEWVDLTEVFDQAVRRPS